MWFGITGKTHGRALLAHGRVFFKNTLYAKEHKTHGPAYWAHSRAFSAGRYNTVILRFCRRKSFFDSIFQSQTHQTRPQIIKLMLFNQLHINFTLSNLNLLITIINQR